MEIRGALPTDLPEIETILLEFDLPSEDCGMHLSNFIVVEEGDCVIAVGGLEICGKHGLVRSIAVIPRYQNRGIGKMIYERVKKRAKAIGINKLFLLTDTAVDYFEKFGFCKIRRTDTPAEIAATRQFRELCPDSATVMCTILDLLPWQLGRA